MYLASSFAVRLMVAFWCLMIVVLSTCYSAEITSSLTVPRLTPVVNSLEELASSSQTQLAIDPGSTFAKACLVRCRQLLNTELEINFFHQTGYSQQSLESTRNSAIRCVLILKISSNHPNTWNAYSSSAMLSTQRFVLNFSTKLFDNNLLLFF